jgi:hypothetical protein
VSPDATALRVVAVFTSVEQARAAETALAPTLAPHRLRILGDVTGTPPRLTPEAPLLSRLVWQIVLWSMVGAVVGVAMGVVFALAGIGPEGVAGFAIQIAGWAIFAHLIAGMWAGYAILSARSVRESHVASSAARIVLAVDCEDEARAAAVERTVRERGATAVARYDSDGRRIAV